MEKEEIRKTLPHKSNDLFQAVAKGCDRFVCSSGGNAGMAAAVCARKLQKPISVYVSAACPENVQRELKNQVRAMLVPDFSVGNIQLTIISEHVLCNIHNKQV